MFLHNVQQWVSTHHQHTHNHTCEHQCQSCKIPATDNWRYLHFVHSRSWSQERRQEPQRAAGEVPEQSSCRLMKKGVKDQRNINSFYSNFLSDRIQLRMSGTIAPSYLIVRSDLTQESYLYATNSVFIFNSRLQLLIYFVICILSLIFVSYENETTEERSRNLSNKGLIRILDFTLQFRAKLYK